jgi:hypothetical protein
MKAFIEKFSDLLGTFSPLIILLLACSCYLASPKKNKHETEKYFPDKKKTEKIMNTNTGRVPPALLINYCKPCTTPKFLAETTHINLL